MCLTETEIGLIFLVHAWSTENCSKADGGRAKISKNKIPGGNKDFHSSIWFLLRYKSQDTEVNNPQEGNSRILQY